MSNDKLYIIVILGMIGFFIYWYQTRLDQPIECPKCKKKNRHKKQIQHKNGKEIADHSGKSPKKQTKSVRFKDGTSNSGHKSTRKSPPKSALKNKGRTDAKYKKHNIKTKIQNDTTDDETTDDNSDKITDDISLDSLDSSDKSDVHADTDDTLSGDSTLDI